jgi:hypothetical protein
MSDINPDVLAQMKRIWSAVNDGTLDRDTVNDALMQMHSFLSGAAYELPDPVVTEEQDEASAAEEHPHKKPRRKR